MRVIFDDEALDDLQRIFAWIAKDNRRAAENLVARIFDRAGRLAAPGHAEMGRPGLDPGRGELIEYPTSSSMRCMRIAVMSWYLVAMLGFDFLTALEKGIAQIVKGHPVEDHAEGMSLVAQGRWCRREHATAQLALPKLYDLKPLASRAFADEAAAATMRTAGRWFCRVRNASGEWQGSSHTE